MSILLTIMSIQKKDKELPRYFFSYMQQIYYNKYTGIIFYHVSTFSNKNIFCTLETTNFPLMSLEVFHCAKSARVFATACSSLVSIGKK